MNEYTKTTYFTKALEEDDPQGRKAAMIFVREHPLMAGRTFVDLVATVILHAPTIVIMTLLIATTQKNFAALRKKNGTAATPAPRPATAGPLQYCYKHEYTSTHSGSVCKFMKDNPTLYQATHLAAKDPLAVPGGNPRVGK
jgi:hypothetical protein